MSKGSLYPMHRPQGHDLNRVPATRQPHLPPQTRRRCVWWHMACGGPILAFTGVTNCRSRTRPTCMSSLGLLGFGVLWQSAALRGTQVGHSKPNGRLGSGQQAAAGRVQFASHPNWRHPNRAPQAP